MYIMPNLNGASIQAALLKLMSLGVKSNQVQMIPKTVNTIDGKIITTNPLSRHALAQGEKVVLIVGVSRGDVLMPDLIGLSLSLATHQITADHIQYSYTYKSASKAVLGEVISQFPQPYSVVSNNTPVQFVLGAHY